MTSTGKGTTCYYCRRPTKPDSDGRCHNCGAPNRTAEIFVGWMNDIINAGIPFR